MAFDHLGRLAGELGDLVQLSAEGLIRMITPSVAERLRVDLGVVAGDDAVALEPAEPLRDGRR